jgi:hypothetical protein
MTTTPRRAPKPAPPPSPVHETEVEPSRNACQFTDLPSAFLAWQQSQPALADVSTLSELLQLARSLNDYGLTLRHRLDECDTTGAVRLSAVITSAFGDEFSSGPLPLPVQSTPQDFIQARILTTELVLGIARDATAADFDAPAQPGTEAKSEPAHPIPAAAPAQPTPAPQAEIDALRLQIETLPQEWIDYLTAAFQTQFEIPAGRKISDLIKSVEHIAFLRSILPQQSAAADGS